MNRTANIKRWVRLVSAGGLLLAGGCPANFSDYQTLATSIGDAVIQSVSDTVFGNIGTDFDTIVRAPVTTFTQSVWGNAVDYYVPDDLPNNPIVRR